MDEINILLIGIIFLINCNLLLFATIIKNYNMTIVNNDVGYNYKGK